MYRNCQLLLISADWLRPKGRPDGGADKKTGKSVRFIRNSIEISVLAAGYILGGSVGIGTAIMAITAGYFIQFSFKLFKFNLKETKHRFIDEDLKYLYDRIRSKKENEKAEGQ